MGNAEAKIDFRKSVIELTSKYPKVEDTLFWTQFWSQSNITTATDVFNLIPQADIRYLRDNAPNNLASLCYKSIECIIKARDTMCPTAEHKKIINSIRLLMRIVPFFYEEPEWRSFFWTVMPSENKDLENKIPIASMLISALSDLLFCLNFTITLPNNTKIENLSALDSCECIWEAGVGFANKPALNAIYDQNRTEILKLLLTLFSEVIYTNVSDQNRMRWIMRFTSAENRHVLPLFTSLLNIVCSYDPVGYGLPYNYLLVGDSREPLVQAAIQMLIVCLDKDSQPQNEESGYIDNFFVNYLSRIHREDDFDFMLKGLTRLLNNPLQISYLPNSTKKVFFHQELLVLLWKCCEYNQKFMYYVLKTSDVLEILVPILYYINDARADSARVGVIHMGVFLILLLSGERNFGVRLNKPFTMKGIIDVPSFNGTHADLLIIVFHKLITTGNYRLQSLFDCLLTIIVNVSPYLKSLSMVTSNKLIHLVEAFSTPWFLFSSSTNHHLVFFLLEMFNNIIQYQFDGNSNLIYTIIRKRQVFHQLSNLNTDSISISQSLKKAKTKSVTENSLPTVPSLPESTSPEKTTESIENFQPKEEKPLAETTSDISASTKEEGYQKDPKIVPACISLTSNTSENKSDENWIPTSEWVESWKKKLPLQTIIRVLQILVPQVEKICIDKGLTDESEILKFLQHGTLVGLLPVPHPILIRKYIANAATNHWFRTYMWGIIYLRSTDPPIWYDTEVNLFEIQRI